MEDKKIKHPTQEEIIAFNVEESNRVKERITYLREQINLEDDRIEEHKEELEKLMFPLKDDYGKWFPTQDMLDEGRL